MVTIALQGYKHSVLKLSALRMMMPFTEDCPRATKGLRLSGLTHQSQAGICTHSRNATGTPIPSLPAYWIQKKYHVQKLSLAGLNDVM